MSVLSPEEMDAYTKRVWESSKEEMDALLKRAIIDELRMGMTSRARHIVARELNSLISPLLEARKEEFQKAAETAVTRIFKRIDFAILQHVEGNLLFYLPNTLESVGKEFVAGVRRVIQSSLDILKKETQT